MTDALTLRPARAGDHAALTALYQRSALSNRAEAAALRANPALLALSPDRLADLVVAESADGTLTGFAALTATPPDAELFALFVDPGHHRQGIGRALIGAALDRARAAGCAFCWVTSNMAARGFYTRLGFRQLGTRQTALGPAPRLCISLTDGAAA